MNSNAIQWQYKEICLIWGIKNVVVIINLIKSLINNKYKYSDITQILFKIIYIDLF